MAPTSVTAKPVAVRCADNTACGELDGDCCPTPQGYSLGCCKDPTNIVSPARATRAACDSNSACRAVGLLGACCPNAKGVTLECCTGANNTVTKPHPVSALCSRNPGCSDIGLAGNCCPGDDGISLTCCPPVTVRGG
mmetsp:Transcript_25793/g.83554  ORF Transcript_25793/g.83554 Transcript_25793/m.83554 type:complete len:137 (+) Transcript_25793:240-650(+)